MSATRVRSGRGWQETVTVTAGEAQDNASFERDVAACFDLGESLRSQGTTEWHSRYRWFGPLKLLVAKEVGPPPWRWPRVQIVYKRTTRRGRPTLRLGAGWRSTAYWLYVIWQRHREGNQ